MSTKTILMDFDLQASIEHAVQTLGGIAKLAKAIGVSERTVYAWKKGDRFPKRATMLRLSDYVQNNQPYPVADGYGPEQCVAEKPSPYGESILYKIPDMLPEEFILIEKAEARPSAGGGSLITSGDKEGSYAFRLDWILSRARSSEGLKLMEISGRSMEKTLHNGDLVLINEFDKTLQEDRLYILRVEDEIYVKRFFRTPGHYHFRSDNRDYADQDVNIDLRDESINWEVVGRVLWAGKEF